MNYNIGINVLESVKLIRKLLESLPHIREKVIIQGECDQIERLVKEEIGYTE